MEARSCKRAVTSRGSNRNLYNEHYLIIDSGTFWYCAHGKTGFDSQCGRCGLTHPIRFIKWWWAINIDLFSMRLGQQLVSQLRHIREGKND